MGIIHHLIAQLRQKINRTLEVFLAKFEEVERAVNLINNRPRKCLDYRNPNEVFYEDRLDSDVIQT
jgi:IS30 family transposase